MKFVLIPDSFKGTLSSREICEIVGERIESHFPGSTVVHVPVADGGEGSVEAFLHAVGGEKIVLQVKNPYFEEMSSFYGILADKKTAVVEMAAAAGLPLVENRKNPLLTSTYGVGELIVDAARRGVSRIIVGLGGSCTNDGGTGAAAAAGIRFFNDRGEAFVPTGGSLKDIARIDASGLDESVKGVEIVTMCDIDNPMFGKQGAAHIFAPQKGADPAMVELLDAGLIHLSDIISRDIKKEVKEIPGSGAAGAMGAGMVAFFNSRLQMGIETVLDTVAFEELIRDADYVFTGEGKLDSQSLRGKVVLGIAGRTKAQKVPLIALVGGAEDDKIAEAFERGVTAVFPINRLPQDFLISREFSRENLAHTADNVLRLIRAARR